MEYIKILIYIFIRILMRLFCIFPVTNNRILFESYKGRSYSCNPKYICEGLLRNANNQFEVIWVLDNQNNLAIPTGIKTVKKRSLANFYYHMTSKIIVANMVDDVYIPLRKDQVFINTWHAGGAYKKVGLSYNGIVSSKITAWQNKIIKKETSYYVSSSRLFTKYNIHDAYDFRGKIIDAGMPRNDLFFNDGHIKAAKDKVVNYYSISNSLVILYAPTFRGDYGKAEKINYSLPYDAIIRSFQDRGISILILVRAHYVFAPLQGVVGDKVIDVSDYPDMQELLATADILITDYSSSIWDYSLMGRPCILYVPDCEEYLSERGTYTPMEKWPGRIVNTEKELIDSLLYIDYEYYKNKANKALEYYGSFEKGTATETILRLIESECRK